MAATYSTIHQSVWGDLRVHILSCTADAASGIIDTGVKTIFGLNIACKSMSTAGIRVVRNLGSGATAIPGRVNFNSGAAGDDFILTVYGK
jgi:hypothetical protein